MNSEIKRPEIFNYHDVVEYIDEMIKYRKKAEPSFSILKASAHLRKVSPTLVSLIIRKKRKVTLDRADEFCKLLNLNSSEKLYFKNWIENLENPKVTTEKIKNYHPTSNRKDVSTHILNDWINVYVKDLFQLTPIRKKPESVQKHLAHIASPKRIDNSLQFLIREGYLKTNQSGEIVVDTNLTVADPRVSSQKIKKFHKGALSLAKSAIDMYPPSERIANTLIIPLNEKSYSQLNDLIEEFANKLKDFAAQNHEEGDRLFQLLVNLSPVGGKNE